MYKELINYATEAYPFLAENTNVKYIPHFHREIELVYVLDGELLFTLGSNNHIIKKGEICIILPNVIHNLFTKNYSKTFVAKLYPVADLNNIKLLNNIVRENEPIYNELKKYLMKIMEENRQRDFGYELSVNSCASYIILMIMRKIQHYKIDNHAKTIIIHDGKFLNMVDDFLDEHKCDNVSLDAIANKLNYTKSYFCRRFKKIMGITFWDYYTMYRLENAIEYIKTTSDMNMTEIAYRSNFKNVRSFNKAFKNFYHCTPLQYKKTIKQQL